MDLGHDSTQVRARIMGCTMGSMRCGMHWPVRVKAPSSCVVYLAINKGVGPYLVPPPLSTSKSNSLIVGAGT